MEFLTQQNIVRVPVDGVNSFILTISFSDSRFCTNFPFCFGQTQGSGRFCSPRQTSFSTASNVSLICLETSYSFSRSSGSNQQYDSIPFEMVDGHQLLRSGNIHSSSRSQYIPLYGCQSLRMGRSSRTSETPFQGRWSEDQSQLHINILEIIAIHFTLKKAIKYIHHSCLMISTDNTTVVSYINKQGGTHSPNSVYWQTVFQGWTDLSKQNGLWISRWRIPFSKMLNFPNVDLFATRFNYNLPLYVSPVPIIL